MGKRKAKKQPIPDLFEAEDGSSEDDQEQNPRYDRVANYQYELPEDFEDEEIDEDEAFNDGDEELYGHIFGKKSTKASTAEEDDEGDIQDFANLTRDDFSDDDSEADRIYGRPKKIQAVPSKKEAKTHQSDSDLDEIFGNEEDADGNMSQSSNDSDSETEMDAEEEARVRKLVSEAVKGPEKKKRKVQKELRTEAVPESEFNLSTGDGELTIADLLAGLGERAGKMSKAEKQLAKLAKDSKPADVPLPGPIRARKERQVGYEDTKKDVTKWQPIVRANREAPTLIFSAPTHEVAQTKTTAALVDKFHAKSSMEEEVAQLLKAAGVQDDESAAQAEEALALQTLTAEEVEKRQNELAKMRSLLYKHESKQKHLAKIKSKDYHRRLKKTAKAKAEKAGELGDKDFIRLQAEQAEYNRAKERLTLKHKNTSKWARRALKRGVNDHADDGKKDALAEQLRLGEELRRRVDRADSVEGSDTDGSAKGGISSDSDSDGDDAAKADRRSQRLRDAANDILAEEDDPDVSKGLFSLPFMKRAAEKQKKAAAHEAEQLLAELDGMNPEDAPRSGRRNFGLPGGTQVGDGELSEPELESDEDEDLEAKLQRLKQAKQEEQRLAKHGNDNADGKTIRPAAKKPVLNGTSKQVKDRKGKLTASKHDRAVQNQNGARTSAEDDGSDSDWGLGQTRPGVFATDGPVRIATQNDSTLETDSRLQQTAQNNVNGSASGLRSDMEYLLKGKPVARDKALESKVNGDSKKQNTVTIGSSQPGGQIDDEASMHFEAQRGQMPFIASKTFQGTKPGYIFSSGPQGVGYYWDQASVSAEKPQKRKPKQGRANKKAAEKQEQSADEEKDRSLRLPSAIQEYADHSDDNSSQQGEMSQRDLIAQAFAGDDVVAEFEEEKQAEAEKELPKIDAPSLLPGWGAWADKQKEPQWMVAAKQKAERRKEAAKAGRKDANLEHVIISEKYDKKSAKYNVASLPFPYTSKAAFEGNLRQPLGAEFNTQTSFRNLNRPAILKHTGVVIKPLRFSQQNAEYAQSVSAKANQNRPSVSKVSGGVTLSMKSRRSLAS